MDEIRFTKRQHQTIQWSGNGLYQYKPENDRWEMMPMEDLVEWIVNPSGRYRFGLVKGFDANNTTAE